MKRGGNYSTYKRDIRGRKRKIDRLVPIDHILRKKYPKAFEDSYNSTQFPLKIPSTSSPSPLTRQQKITEKRLNTLKENKAEKARQWAEKKEYRAERRSFHSKRKGIQRYRRKLRRRGFNDGLQEKLINRRFE
jgi:16S rRNA C967 or C1407 C5-methylase (RsmB/RsmF family)